MTMTPEQVAAGLSDNQKWTLRLAPFLTVFSWAAFSLILKGLLNYRRRFWLFGPKILIPTRLGLQVRAILEQQK